jgi:hypothetical protein
MATLFNNVANTNTVNYVPVQATFDAANNFITFIGPGGVPFSTGSGSTFATDITVNGLTVGRGDGNVASNTVFGNNALSNSLVTSANINNVAIGTNALQNLTTGIQNVTTINAGSGYTDGTYFDVQLVYVSGTPVIAGGTYPTINLEVIGNQVFFDSLATYGTGFVDTTTVMSFAGLGGSGALFGVSALLKGEKNVAIGYNAGGNITYQRDSVYIGNNTLSTFNPDSSNEIVIGSNATGGGNNTTTIGNSSTTSTILKGLVTTDGGITVPGQASIASNAGVAASIGTGTNSTISIGTSASTDRTITIGSSTGTGTFSVGLSAETHTMNIGTGATPSGSTKTINIGSQGVSTSTTTINVGSTASTTTIALRGLINGRVYTVSTLPTGIAGSRAYVSDALAPSFGAAVVGGGAVGVPVYKDGTSWKVG